MVEFSFIPAAIGGLLIGLATALLLILNGRIAGISGIVSGILSPTKGDTRWKIVFVAAIIIGALLTPLITGEPFAFEMAASWPVIIIGGFLVGFGTRLGSGCTSGHGVCGISRLSRRSIVATVTFIAAGAVTVLLVRVGFGGVL